MDNKIGSYLVEKIIARTQASVLYRAKKDSADAEVDNLFYVIKENLLPDMLTLQAEAEINQEIEVLSPRSIVIPMTMSGQNGTEYGIMHFKANGMFLSDIIQYYEKEKHYKVPLKLQLDMMSGMLSSLHCLHHFRKDSDHRGYLHLDLHPGNIFFENADLEENKAGTAKFIDFSSAQPIQHGSCAKTRCSKAGVTAGYSAPEKYYPDACYVEEATDLYSAAAIFARMLTGVEIIGNEHGDTSYLDEEHLDHLNPVVRHSVRRFLKHGLTDNSAYRFRTAEEMGRDLNQIAKLQEYYDSCAYYELFREMYGQGMTMEGISFADMAWDKQAFAKAVSTLEKELCQRVIDANMQYFIYKGLKGLIDNIPDREISPIATNKLLRSGMACCNHLGKSGEAIECFEKMRQGRQLSVSDYIDNIPRFAESFKDSYQYEKARDLLEEDVAALERLKHCRHTISSRPGIFEGSSVRQIELGRAYSSLAGVKTLLHGEGTENLFRKALDEFEEYDTNNRRITIAHILHSAAEYGNKDLFEEFAPVYFSDDFMEKTAHTADSKLSEWYSYAVSELTNHNNKYPLFALIKGFRYFYSDNMDDGWLDKLGSLADSGLLDKRGGYPLNIIYKYIALLFASGKDREEKARELFRKAVLMCCPEGILLDRKLDIMVLISYGIIAEGIEAVEDGDGRERVFEQLLEHSSQPGWETLHRKMVEMQQDGDMDIRKLFRYEYA